MNHRKAETRTLNGRLLKSVVDDADNYDDDLDLPPTQ